MKLHNHIPTYDFGVLDLHQLFVREAFDRYNNELELLKECIDDGVSYCLGGEVSDDFGTIGDIEDDIVTPQSFTLDEALDRLLTLQMNFHSNEGYIAFREKREPNKLAPFRQQTTVGVLVTRLAIDMNKAGFVGLHVDTEEQGDYLDEYYPDALDSGFIRQNEEYPQSQLFFYKSPSDLHLAKNTIALGEKEFRVCGAGLKQKISPDQYQSTDLAYIHGGLLVNTMIIGHLDQIAEPPPSLVRALMEAAES
tara:strand:- start:385 stop:1137 length:753 start_codon:yes stop_codon:yes gene_type:complete